MCLCLVVAAHAQDDIDHPGHVNPEDMQVDMDNPTFVPMVKVGKVLMGRDSIQYVELNNVWVFTQPVFKNAQERAAFNRLVYNVKKVLPIAKEVNRIIIETGDYPTVRVSCSSSSSIANATVPAMTSSKPFSVPCVPASIKPSPGCLVPA